jgi:hypothetical protein
MKRVTFTLDEPTVASLERTAGRLGVAESQVVREAIRVYGVQAGRPMGPWRVRLSGFRGFSIICDDD